ncbi:MAG: EscU/YscU/HrcU family type III secretion system export apparatus switch protein [Hyphomicrobiaceae bacterium]|nr:EscU/YscU/HrcU family type III secretion system export apparatus switch protein [Hyphomicrobiaceae bacterium]
MSNDTGEQRTLPATDKKLQDARKKGQVAHSRDLVSAVGGTAAIIYLWLNIGGIVGEWRDVMLQSLTLGENGFRADLRRSLSILADQSLRTLAPLLACVVAAGVLASLAVTKGPAPSLDPIKPKLDILNPAQGLKRIFGLRGWIELAKTLVKFAVFASVLLLVVGGTWQTLVRLPVCGVGCIPFLFGSLAKLLLGIAVCAYLVAAIVDVLLQRWLFLRDMQMTPTELKRERKDLEGNPLIRRAQQQQRREAAAEPRLGVDQATIIIRAPGVAVGLRYVRGETDVPLIVCRGRDSTADAIMRSAATHATPTCDDAELAKGLSSGVRLGAPIPRRYFQSVARALYAAGAAD